VPIPKDATELLRAANEGFCLSVADLADLRAVRERPWRWQRVLPKWFVEHKRELERMMKMIGNGKFRSEENKKNARFGQVVALDVVSELQPHTPVEHDMFAALVKQYSGKLSLTASISIDRGQLKISYSIAVPELEAVPAEEHPEKRVGMALKSDRDELRRKKAEVDEANRKEQEAAAKKAEKPAAPPSV
jgi:hypothetical protein